MAEEHYQVLARKWRPQTFEEVVGQEHITRTLQNAIAAGRVGHAFLFIGSRGIGKTTTARILAKALNCQSADAPTSHPCNKCDNCLSIAAGTNIDVIEIDGASNNSVDDVREIREHIRLVPSRSRFKVYVIDEVHQLSAGAFNALLKTLEEPPPHGVFILATTEVHKIPATIISRCQRFDFRRVGMTDLRTLLRRILETERKKCTEEALLAIARAAEGGVRDAESILDQLMSYCNEEISFQDVLDVLGLVDWQVMHSLCDALLAKDIPGQLRIVEDVVAKGKDLALFVQEILSYFRNLLISKTADAKALLALPDQEIAALHERANQFTLTQLIRLIEQFAELSKSFDSQAAQRIALETVLIRISKLAVDVSVDTVLEKILLLKQGASVAQTRRTPPNNPPMQAAPSAAPSRLRVTNANLRTAWAKIVDAAARTRMSLKVWLVHAKPLKVEGDCVEVTFGHQHAQAHNTLLQNENRQALEEALRTVTENITSFRAVLAPEDGSPEEADHSGEPIRVSSEEERTLLQDPHVAKVIDVFKGRIVDVRHDVEE